jgi:hypothetical protein
MDPRQRLKNIKTTLNYLQKKLQVQQQKGLRYAAQETEKDIRTWLGNKERIEKEIARAKDGFEHITDPAEHLANAQNREIAGDKARAADSYKAAAAGFRLKRDSGGLAQAEDGLKACNPLSTAARYDHPSRGRVKVCDSASTALRTALERTRAGERVKVVDSTCIPAEYCPQCHKDAARCRCPNKDELLSGYTVGGKRVTDSTVEPLGRVEKVPVVAGPRKPGQAQPANGWFGASPKKAKDADETWQDKRDRLLRDKDDIGACNQCRRDVGRHTKEQAERCMAAAERAKDEHEGFAKLKGELGHEKGVTDPGALAASIGRKKYGAAGMAAKSAAGRAKDAENEEDHKFSPGSEHKFVRDPNRREAVCKICRRGPSNLVHVKDAVLPV